MKGAGALAQPWFMLRFLSLLTFAALLQGCGGSDPQSSNQQGEPGPSETGGAPPWGTGGSPAGGTGGDAGGAVTGTGGSAVGTGGDAGTGGSAVGTGGDAGTGGSVGELPVLSLEGNPAIQWFDGARTRWSGALADLILSYQQSHGGWPKNVDYTTAGTGTGGEDLGTFDNGATVTEVVYLAELYRGTKDTKYRDSIRKAFDFILAAQYPSGGWPQFYPLRGGYSDHVTFNDDAMVHVLTVLHQAAESVPPFDTDLFSDGDRDEFRAAIAGGVDYILKAQWMQGDTLTVWCAQHGATDYQPKAARAYELESLSGSESVGVIAFLMTQPQAPEIETAVKAALSWYRSDDTVLDGYGYDTGQCPDGNPIAAQTGSRIWYRFYKLDTNAGFFSDRDGGTYFDLMEISQERRCGYRWAGNWGDRIIAYAESVGY